jgi:hypothetical protein
MTYGQLKKRLVAAFPGISLDLIEGWINDRYAEILGELPWTRLNLQANLQTIAPYSTGTVAVTLGSAAVTLTAGVFTAAMTTRAFRAAGRDEFYRFTYVSATTGTLDRVYEGPAATAATYVIFQNVYVLPSDCRLLEDDAFSTSWGTLTRMAHGQLNDADPTRAVTGKPQIWASYMDDSSTPPLMRIELVPYPDLAIGIPFTYAADAGELTDTGTIIKVWLQPSALVEGATSRIKAHLKDYNGAVLHRKWSEEALVTMRGAEAQGMGMAKIELDPYYTAHRSGRCRG